MSTLLKFDFVIKQEKTTLQFLVFLHSYLPCFHNTIACATKQGKTTLKQMSCTKLPTLLENASSMDSVDSLHKASIKWCKATSFKYLWRIEHLRKVKTEKWNMNLIDKWYRNAINSLFFLFLFQQVSS